MAAEPRHVPADDTVITHVGPDGELWIEFVHHAATVVLAPGTAGFDVGPDGDFETYRAVREMVEAHFARLDGRED